jgi:hypothetical protein
VQVVKSSVRSGRVAAASAIKKVKSERRGGEARSKRLQVDDFDAHHILTAVLLAAHDHARVVRYQTRMVLLSSQPV